MNDQRSGAAGESAHPLGGNPAPGTAGVTLQPSVAELFAAALRYHQVGRLADAESLYRRVLAAVPDHSDALHLLGVMAYQLGRLDMAIELISRALQHNGNYPSYHSSCGLVLQALHRLDEAVASYDRALSLKPDYVEALTNRGLALEQLEQFAEALVSYERALAIKPEYPEAWNNRGNALQQLGRWAEAVESYDRALALRPDLAEACYNRGTALQELKRPDEAVASYDRALTIKPDYAEALNDRGDTLRALGRFIEAVESCQQLLALRPEDTEALLKCGNALRQLGRFTEAVESYDRALALRPDYAAALLNRANTLQTLGRSVEALESYDRVLALRPDYATALLNRGNTLQVLGRSVEALENYDRALTLQPDYAEAFYNRGVTLRLQGQLREAIDSFGQAAALALDCAVAEWFNLKQTVCDWSNYREDEAKARNAIKAEVSPFAPFALLALSSTSKEQLDCTRRVSGTIAVPEADELTCPLPRLGERIRLGYLSADFHQHPVAFLIAELIERHNRERFEILGYCCGPDDGSAVRARLIGAFDRFVEVGKMPDRQAAQAIHADAVDILVDLTGYTANGRTAVLAYRPAPIQVNYLGYPGTMGAEFFDYIIVDPFLVPLNQQPFYSERLVQLPSCFQPSDTLRKAAQPHPSRTLCGLPEESFVFCCFNGSYKITPTFFDIWMRLLSAVPGSALWLVEANALMKDNLRCEAVRRGIGAERLAFAPRLPMPEHLARIGLADLFLDTLPYSAGAMANEALWAGLPVLTCAGETYVGRMAGSILTAAGLPELITASLEEYEALAVRLATEPGQLVGLRQKLESNRSTMPLFNIARFTRDLEAAYAHMWETWRSGRAPTTFSLGPAPVS
jgi:protein O-GlcNAc transferase